MASDPDNESMLRRMVKMVTSTVRDSSGAPADLGASSQFVDVDKAELKAMIERKRRNDFVRKRELDMLRRIRREGLNVAQANALGASSNLDDSDVRVTQLPGPAGPGVKAKIDAIERQMVGGAPAAPPPLINRNVRSPLPAPPLLTRAIDDQTTLPPPEPARPSGLGQPPVRISAEPDPVAKPRSQPGAARLPTLDPVVRIPMPPAAPTAPTPAYVPQPFRPTEPMPVEATEISHDPELDEAVIAFASADFNTCERVLVNMTGPSGARRRHNDTWLTLFDFYRATGQHVKFELLTTDYVTLFQRSAPQWFSLPKLVSDATTQSPDNDAGPSELAWICPPTLDADAVVQLNSQCLQLPLPWVLDWSPLQSISPDAAMRLSRLMQGWSHQALDMRWPGSDQLFAVLEATAPVGVRDADPVFWMLRLEALRLVNRPDQFDEVAIDYCVTYEVSPPSWEPSKAIARGAETAQLTQSAPMSLLSEAVTTVHGGEDEGKSGLKLTSLELSGQLSGDIGEMLAMLDRRIGMARAVRISCALLIRVDFIAAGDLLNWVISKRSEGRETRFTDVHRLVALMFGAMGIIEHTQVELRHA
jgi:hypothetical protein